MEDGRRVTKRVSFSLEEDRIVREKAKEAGMSITAYIRQQALEGQVVSVDWEMIRQHTEAINRIAFDIGVYTSNQNPNIWMFGADIDLIREELEKIYELEKRLIELLTGEQE